jgi:serine/threonine protein kinase
VGLDAALSITGEAVFLEDPPLPGPYAPDDLVCQKYRLIEPIGFGGMGAVWRAHNEILDVPVALKLIRSDARLARCAERLLIEARVAAGIRHASVVRVFDFGKTQQGDPFIVMELLQGESLRDVLDREGHLSAIEAVRNLLPILGGIGCAHGRGVIHRDLKPENIFLARDDTGCVQPKVLDFGIAKLVGEVSHLTTRGMLLGSPEYMAPEQAQGDEEIDHRVDIWAAAVVLYEMIAGRAPWESPNCPALLRAIVDDRPPKLTEVCDVDARLWAIVERGLAKNRDKRWTSAQTFGRALAGWLLSRSVAADVSGGSLRATWIDQGGSADTASATAAAPAERKDVSSPRRLVSRRLLHPGRPLKFTAGLAASILLLGVGYRSSSAPAASLNAPATVAASWPVNAPAPRDINLDAEIPSEANVPSTAPSVPAPSVNRASAVRSGRSRRAPNPLASAAPLTKESARAMDFGF